MLMHAKEPSDLSLGTVEKLEIHIHPRILPPATTNLLAWPYRRTEYLDELQEDTYFGDILLPKDLLELQSLPEWVHLVWFPFPAYVDATV